MHGLLGVYSIIVHCSIRFEYSIDSVTVHFNSLSSCKTVCGAAGDTVDS